MFYEVGALVELIDNLPDEFLETLPVYHSDITDDVGDDCICDAPLLINETLTVLQCSDTFCPYRVAQRIVEMLTLLGIKGIGPAIALKIVQKFGITNPAMLFAYNPYATYNDDGTLSEEGDGELADGFNLERSVVIAKELQSKNSMTLWEYIRLCKIPNIAEDARKLFGDYTSLDDFKHDWENQGLELFHEKLKTDGEIIVATKAASLKQYWDTLYAPLDYINLAENKELISVVLSKMNGKDAYKRRLQERYSDCNFTFHFSNSVSKSTMFVVTADVNNSSNKLNKVRQDGYIAEITTPDGLIDILDAWV